MALMPPAILPTDPLGTSWLTLFAPAIGGALSTKPAESRSDQIVSLATPFDGSQWTVNVGSGSAKGGDRGLDLGLIGTLALAALAGLVAIKIVKGAA